MHISTHPSSPSSSPSPAPNPTHLRLHTHIPIPTPKLPFLPTLRVHTLPTTLNLAPLVRVVGRVHFVGRDARSFVFDFLGQDQVEEDGEEGRYCGTGGLVLVFWGVWE